MKPCNAATYRKATFDLAFAEKPKVIVEVGVYAGALSRMLSNIPGVNEQYIVDSWEGGYSNFSRKHMDAIAADVIEWAKSVPKNIVVLRKRSIDAAPMFDSESIDFFHTDGDHSLLGITTDITSWLPKVRAGGILSGDNFEIPTVAQAVKRLLPHYRLGANGRLWWCRKA